MQILLQNATLIDAAWPEARQGSLLVEDGLIRDLDASPQAASLQPDRQTIDLGGRAVIPGLIDSHVHVMASMMDLAANAQLPAPLAILRAVPILNGMLERGFTTVRDTGGAHPALAEAIAQGLTPGPRLFTCGKALSKTGGHSDARPRYDTGDANPWTANAGALGRIADGIDQVRLACRQQLREGAAFIKIMGSGGVASPTDPIHCYGYTPDEIRAAVDECRDAHTYVAAHVYTPDTITRAVDCGVHSLEHCNNIDAAAARRAVQAQAVAVPHPRHLRGPRAGRSRSRPAGRLHRQD
ncbi:MAG: amidohydrolase family protein [Acidobacteriaceae bacterium]